MKFLRDHKYFYVLMLTLFVISLIGLESIPPLWWDEGWTLNVARNWIEYGHYGQFNDNQPQSPGLSAGITTVFPAAISFKLFGVGPLQGRFPFVLICSLTLGLIYWLGKKLYDIRLSKASLIILLFITPFVVGPIWNSRQVLADIPSAFFLLLGYIMIFISFQRHSIWFAFASGIIWGICMISKAQIWPFLLFSIFTILIITLILHWRKLTLMTLISLGAALASWRLFLYLYSAWVAHFGGQPGMAMDLYSVTAVVLNSNVRIMALKYLLSYGLLSLAGTLMTVWILYKEYSALTEIHAPVYLVRLGLTVFSASWLLWYVLVGMYYARYLVIPVFVSSLFAADLIRRLTKDFDIRETIRRTSAFLLGRKLSFENALALIAVLLLDISLALNIITFFIYISGHQTISVKPVTDYLNSYSPNNALIETYDSQLFFLLDRRYHYPPDDSHVSYIKRALFNEAVQINYDPLAANPDYLVLGDASKTWQVYDRVITDGKFKLIQSLPGYEIYERNY